MEAGRDPPRPQGVKQHGARHARLVRVKLVEEPMARVARVKEPFEFFAEHVHLPVVQEPHAGHVAAAAIGLQLLVAEVKARFDPTPELSFFLVRDAGEARFDVAETDALVPSLPEHGLSSSPLDEAVRSADCVCIVTKHSGIDYDSIAEKAKLVVDFRNATGDVGAKRDTVWKL